MRLLACVFFLASWLLNIYQHSTAQTLMLIKVFQTHDFKMFFSQTEDVLKAKLQM